MFSRNWQAMLAFKHRLAVDAILAKFSRTALELACQLGENIVRA